MRDRLIFEELAIIENFRTLVKYLAMPKEIDRLIFEREIIDKITVNDDKNFIKSVYQLNQEKKTYIFKIETGKTAKNLNRFFDIFEKINFITKDIFPNNSYDIINKVYDNGNTYVHARKSSNTPKDDAINNLNGIGEVLFELYGVNEIPINQTIKSGYKNTNIYFRFFDNILFIDNSKQNDVYSNILQIEKGVVVLMTDIVPDYFRHRLPDIYEFIVTN